MKRLINSLLCKLKRTGKVHKKIAYVGIVIRCVDGVFCNNQLII